VFEKSKIVAFVISEVQGVQEELRQRLQAPETHDLTRRVSRPPAVQMCRLWQGFQIQAPFEGNCNIYAE
jgi:hypothetical protein